MVIHSSTLCEEVRELQQEMSVEELIDMIDSDTTLVCIQTALEEIALERIIQRTQEYEDIIERGKV